MSDREKNALSEDPGRHADERLLHALLLHTYDDQAKEHREARVQPAIQVISSASQADGMALNANEPIGIARKLVRRRIPCTAETQR